MLLTGSPLFLLVLVLYRTEFAYKNVITFTTDYIRYSGRVDLLSRVHWLVLEIFFKLVGDTKVFLRQMHLNGLILVYGESEVKLFACKEIINQW
jgi:hypothetical protein